ncbi:MAG: ABC transporter substrate-binding protein [Bacillota bacterium]
MKKYLHHCLFLIPILLMVSCSTAETRDLGNSGNSQVDLIEKETDKSQENTESSTPKTDKITVWGYYDGWIQGKKNFENEHPGITIEFQKVDGNVTEKYLSALASGSPPDILLVQSSQMGQLNLIEGLENLFGPPYNAGEEIDKFSEHQLSWTRSLDGKKLLALPLVHNPSVLYYRSDILEQYGFPTDPEELGEYMEDPQRWIAMIRELKKHNKWVLQWRMDPIEVVSSDQGFFDNNMKFVRNTRDYEIVLSLARQVKEEGLELSQGIWDPVGQESIREGKIVMVQLGSWGEYTLNSWAPETKGKWRVTRLPFGVYAANGASALAITSQSKYKELAWKFVKKIVDDDRRYYKDIVNNKSNFLGGQHAEKLYAELREKIPLVYCTPMDLKLSRWWDERMYDFIHSSEGDASGELDRIEETIYKDYNKEISSILRYMD